MVSKLNDDADIYTINTTLIRFKCVTAMSVQTQRTRHAISYRSISQSLRKAGHHIVDMAIRVDSCSKHDETIMNNDLIYTPK